MCKQRPMGLTFRPCVLSRAVLVEQSVLATFLCSHRRVFPDTLRLADNGASRSSISKLAEKGLLRSLDYGKKSIASAGQM